MTLQALRLARQQRGWSQARLAEALGVSTRTVNRWEQGTARPYPYYRKQLAELFGQSLQQLGFISDSPDPQQEDAGSEQSSAAQKTLSSGTFLVDPLIPHTLGHSTHLLGCHSLLSHIKTQLFSHPTFALHGLPGIGKTALAVALALDSEVQAHFVDGILWAGLGPQPNLLSLFSRWGRLLNIRPADVEDVQQERSWAQALQAVLYTKRMLLIIDDAWNERDALLLHVGGPHCSHLLTTRLPQVSFAFAQQSSLVIPELEENEGVKLLARYVPQLIEQEPGQIHALVQAVSGLPLALHLIGSHLAAHALSGQPGRLLRALKMARNVQHRLSLAQVTSERERPPALPDDVPLSLSATIAVSEQRLSVKARVALHALSFYPARPDSFSEEAALWASGTDAEVLDELWDTGLLESAAPGRYTLHQTIADYARAQMNQAEQDAVQQRLFKGWFPWMYQHANDYLFLDKEWSNIQAVLQAGSAYQGTIQELLQATLSLQPYLRSRGLYQQAEQYLRAGLSSAEKLQDNKLHMLFIREFAELTTAQANYIQVEMWVNKGLALAADQEAHIAVRCDLLIMLALVRRHLRDYLHAQSYFEDALTLARKIHDDRRICRVMAGLGRTSRQQGNYALASEMLQAALDLTQHLNLQEQECCLLNVLADCYNDQGTYLEAKEYSQQGLALARRLGHRQLQGYHLETFADAELGLGHFESAELHYLEALTIMRQIGTRSTTRIVTNLSSIARQRGDEQQAMAYLQEAQE